MRRFMFGPYTFEDIINGVTNSNEVVDRDTDLFYIVDNEGNKTAEGIDIALPGVDKSRVSINIDDGRIIIEVPQYDYTKSDNRIRYIEGKETINKSGFKTSFEVDSNKLDLSKLVASMENGILRIVIPVHVKAKARSVKIN